MAQTCATCGNHYEHAFRVIDARNREFWFDSFECAIHKLAPVCRHWGCKVIGHVVDDDGNGAIFCCNHCWTHQH